MYPVLHILTNHIHNFGVDTVQNGHYFILPSLVLYILTNHKIAFLNDLREQYARSSKLVLVVRPPTALNTRCRLPNSVSSSSCLASASWCTSCNDERRLEMQNPGFTESIAIIEGGRRCWKARAKSILSNFESKYRRFMISGVQYSLLNSLARMLGDSTSSSSNVVQ